MFLQCCDVFYMYIYTGASRNHFDWGGGGCVFIESPEYAIFIKIARILSDALTTTNVATYDRIFHYFARISPYFARTFPVFLNFGMV